MQSLSDTNVSINADVIIDGGMYGKFVFNTRNLIGKGTFARVFKGRNMHTYEEVAIKTEPMKSVQLLKEHQSYEILGATHRYHNVPGIPEVYYKSTIGLHCTAMAMELLGPSLNDLFKICGKKFSLKTVLMIAIQMTTRLEYVHSRMLIHGDIKPENVLVGRPRQTLPYVESTENTLYLIDYGVARRYVDPETGMHVPCRKDVGVFGTYEFMSVNANLKIEQSRRDDLETLGYMLVYFANGTLPWIKYLEGKIDLKKCMELKAHITLETLCDGLPEEFVKYFDYVKNLEHSSEPDYEMLRTLFNSAYEGNKFPDDKLFDWSMVHTY